MSRRTLSLLLFLTWIGLAPSVSAQQSDSVETADETATPEPGMQGTWEADRTGTAVLAGWPRSLPDLLDRMGRRAPRLLPKLDTLTVAYAYDTQPEDVLMSFGLRWVPGPSVLYRGEVLARRDAPRDIRMTSVELLLDVVRGGQKLSEIVVAVDSMALPASPGYYPFDVRVPYDRVFLETSSDTARAYLERGVTLERPTVERVGFNAFRDGRIVGDAQEAPRAEEPSARHGEPARPPFYQPRSRIIIGWRIGPDPYFVTSRGDRRRPDADEDRVALRPVPRDRDGRSATGGRTAEESADPEREGRTGRSSGGGEDGKTPGAGDADDKSDGRDDDDEDDDSLAPAAIGAAVAVAGVAYFGGTVGIYATGDTPLGLTAGVTRSRWGVHLQAAVNPEVIEQETVQRLSAKVLGFYDVIGTSVIQPAVGLGIQARAVDDKTTLHPAISFGAVLNTGRIVLFGGYDVARKTPEFSLAYNFRAAR